jgi:hypothetical protein
VGCAALRRVLEAAGSTWLLPEEFIISWRIEMAVVSSSVVTRDAFRSPTLRQSALWMNVESGVRVAGVVLSSTQAKQLVKAALKRLPKWQAKEIEAQFFGGYPQETISPAAISALQVAIAQIVAAPLEFGAILA